MNPSEQERLQRIVQEHAPAQPQQQLAETTEVRVTTLLGVSVDVACQPNGQQILVIQKMRNGQPGDQLHVPMDAIYAAGVRSRWDASLAAARGQNGGDSAAGEAES